MSWQNYKKTFRTEGDLFDFARSGDLRGLANLLSESSSFDVNAVNNRGYSALMLAVYNGEKDFCEALLRCGADVNSIDAVGNSVLMAAAYKGEISIVELLFQFDADIALKNKTNMNVRDWAQMFGRKGVLIYLDKNYPEQAKSSKLKNIIRFIKLGVILIRNKFNSKNL